MINSRRIFRLCFFFLAVALLSGRSVQIGGMLLFGLLCPCLAYRQHFPENSRKLARLAGAVALLASATFPVIDLLGFYFRLEERDLTVKSWTILLGGQFGSVLLLPGLLLLGISFLDRSARADCSQLSSFELLDSFVNGLLVGTLVLSIYNTIQFLTGYNIYQIAAYRPDRIMTGTFYRITGFLEHPVSYAGVALAVFSFSLSLLLSRQRLDLQEYVARWKLFFITIAHFLFIAASGSRMALIAAFVVMVVLVFRASGPMGLKLVYSSGVVLVTGFATAITGMSARLAEALQSPNIWGNRLIFWKVHWQIFREHLFLGAGSYWLREGERERYYALFGYGDFAQKYNAHNNWLELLSNVGIIGSTVIHICFLTLFILVQRFRTDNRMLQPLASALGYGFLSLLLFGLTQNSLFDVSTAIALPVFFSLFFWASALTKVNG